MPPTAVIVTEPQKSSSADGKPCRLRRARQAVALSGVSEDVLRSAEVHGPVDWGRLAWITGSLFSMAGGGLGTQRFWSRPAVELGLRSPLEVLGDPGGPAAISAYGELFARRAIARKTELRLTRHQYVSAKSGTSIRSP